MNSYLTLTKLQLRLRLAALFPKGAKGIDWKRLGLNFLAFLGIACLVGFAVFMEYWIMEGLKALQAPRLILSLTLFMVMATCLCISFFYVMSVLFFSKDSGFIAALPVSSRTVLGSRLTLVLLGEAGLSLLIMGPAVVFYGLHTETAGWFYGLGFLTAVTAPMLPIAIVTGLSTLLIRLSALWKHREAFTIIGSVVLIAGVVYAQMSLTMHIPENAGGAFFLAMLSGNLSFLENLAYGFPPVRWAVEGMTALQPGYLGYLTLSLGAIALVILLLGGSYMKLALLQAETSGSSGGKRRKRAAAYTQHKPLTALFIREWRGIFRSPTYLFNSLAGAMVLPIIALAGGLGVGSKADNLEAAFEMINSALNRVEAGIIILGLAGVLGFVSSMNPAVATAVSREGGTHFMSRLLPVDRKIQMQAKLLMGMGISSLVLVMSAGIILIMFPGIALHILIASVLGLVFCLMCACICLTVDMLHPKLVWRNETEVMKRSFSVFLGTLLGMALALLIGFGCYGLYTMGLGWNQMLAVVSAVIFLGAWGSYWVLMRLAGSPKVLREM